MTGDDNEPAHSALKTLRGVQRARAKNFYGFADAQLKQADSTELFWVMTAES